MSLLLDYLDLVMFAAMCGVILIGFPVTFTLAGLAVLFAAAGYVSGQLQPAILGALAPRIFGIMTNPVLIAIPLFVLMGAILERSRIAEELLEEMGRLFGRLRGGLAVSVTVVGALLAASTGIVGATVVTMSLISLPTMLRHGYDPRFAAGAVCSAATLAQIIPPSTMLIILSEVMSAGYQQAQYEKGLFTIETLSVGQVFAAALVPGLVMVAVYIAFILLRAALRPEDAPPVPEPAGGDRARRLGRVLLPPIVLIVAVLGSILGGVATPTEAASVGAGGALLLAARRVDARAARLPVAAAFAAATAMLVLSGLFDLRLGRLAAVDAPGRIAIAIALVLAAVFAWGIWRALRLALASGILVEAVTSTMTITAMIFGTIIGASVFSLVFRGLGGDVHIEQLLAGMPGGATGALLFVMLLIFVLGFFLDFVEIAIIVLPVVVPVLVLMGLDPVWLAVLIGINLQTSFMTPPFGFSLFYMRGAAPPELSTGDIYRGVVPFILLQAVVVFAVWLFPPLATWLPRALFG